MHPLGLRDSSVQSIKPGVVIQIVHVHLHVYNVLVDIRDVVRNHINICVG